MNFKSLEQNTKREGFSHTHSLDKLQFYRKAEEAMATRVLFFFFFFFKELLLTPRAPASWPKIYSNSR